MASKISWLLPAGVEEILPPRALQIEMFRRKIIDLFVQSGYELIMPPILEFSDTLGGQAHEELSEVSFSFDDRVSGKSISLRPDISAQASRIDAYRIQGKTKSKLCYVGDVVKSKSSQVISSRLTVQAGAEIFGDSSFESDIESIRLMISSLESIKIKNITLSIGHAGLINLILNYFNKLLPTKEEAIRSALSTKSTKDIKELITKNVSKKDVDLLLSITGLFGGKETLDNARRKLKELGTEAMVFIDYIENIVNEFKEDDIQIHIDLGEIQGFKYHNGLTFSAFIKEASYPLAKGGRYDGISKLDNPRPAVGFDLDLVAVSNFTDCDLNGR